MDHGKSADALRSRRSFVLGATAVVAATPVAPAAGSAMSKRKSPTANGMVKCEGDHIHFETQGTGQPLLMIAGGIGDGAVFDAVVPYLAGKYQVITYDRRGAGRSTRRQPQNFEMSQQARDAVAVIKAAGHARAHVFGTSAGALIALEMARSQPQAVLKLVAHEPPAVKLLPDATDWLKRWASYYVMALDNPATGMAEFLKNIKLAPQSTNLPASTGFMERLPGEIDFFMTQEFMGFGAYCPDTQAILKNSVRPIISIGQFSADSATFYARASAIISRQLGAAPSMFPGDHGSYKVIPELWSRSLLAVLDQG